MKKKDPVIEMIKLAFGSLSYEKRFETITELLHIHDASTINESINATAMHADQIRPLNPSA